MKILKHVSIALLLAVMAASPALANGTFLSGASVSTSARETVRNAGVDGNYNIEVYFTADGHVPNAEDKARGPAYTQEGNMLEPAVTKRVPGFPDGKFWAVVNWKPLNAGEIKTERTECEAVELPYSEELGGYLIDLSQLPPGKYFIGITVGHMGGENVMQILIFIFRSKRMVLDQAGFWLTVYDPLRPYYRAEVLASPYMRGFEPLNGAKSFESATEEAAPIELMPEEQPQELQLQPEFLGPTGSVTIALDTPNGCRGLEQNPSVTILSNGRPVASGPVAGVKTFENIPVGAIEVLLQRQPGETWPLAPDHYQTYQDESGRTRYTKVLSKGQNVKFRIQKGGSSS